ncbi:MAG TPA: hypothetical protein VFW87_03760 [Pirellulales bacterium]|nr:hypothetical protein [Pirellulales bacterium]
MAGVNRKAKKGFFSGVLAGDWLPLRKEPAGKRTAAKRSALVERLESRELLSISPSDPQAALVGNRSRRGEE